MDLVEGFSRVTLRESWLENCMFPMIVKKHGRKFSNFTQSNSISLQVMALAYLSMFSGLPGPIHPESTPIER